MGDQVDLYGNQRRKPQIAAAAEEPHLAKTNAKSIFNRKIMLSTVVVIKMERRDVLAQVTIYRRHRKP